MATIINNFPKTIKTGSDTSDATATADKILKDYTAYAGNSKITGTIESIDAKTIIPSTENKVISNGLYLNGDQTILGDPNLISSNIKAGTTIFGVEGDPNVVDTTITKSAATSSYMQKDRVAYVNGELKRGAVETLTQYEYTISDTDVSIVGPRFIEKDHTLLIHGEPNLIADNIKAGVSIGNITGTYGGEGYDFSQATITTDKILEGFKGFDKNGDLITGTIPTITTTSITPSTVEQYIEPGFVGERISIFGDISLATENIKAGTTIFGVEGKATVVDTEVSGSNTISGSNCMKDMIGYVNGNKVVGTCETLKNAVFTPTAEDQIITGPKILQGNSTMTIKGDELLVPENIKKNITIFGVEGNLDPGIDTSDATATAEDMKNGVTAYVNGELITGSAYTRGTYVVPVDGTKHWSAAGFYAGIETPAEPNLIPSNIKKDVIIYGVKGTMEGGVSPVVDDLVMNTINLTSAEEVFTYFNNGEDCWVTDGDEDVFYKIPDSYIYNKLCCNKTTIDGITMAGVSIQAGEAYQSVLFKKPITISNNHALIYYTYLVSTWISPTVEIQLIPITAVSRTDDTITADFTEIAFTKSINLAPAANGNKLFSETNNLPLGTYYLMITMNSPTGGNDAIIGELGILEL